MSIIPPTTPITQSITITPGQQFVVPAGATIDMIIANGDATATADCEIPDPEEYVCSYFKITMNQDGDQGRPMAETTTRLDSLTVGNTVFSFNDQLIIVLGADPGQLISLTTLNSYITDQGLFKFTNITRDTLTSTSERQIIWMYFQVPSILLNTLELEVLDKGNPQYFKPGPTAIECGQYPNP